MNKNSQNKFATGDMVVISRHRITCLITGDGIGSETFVKWPAIVLSTPPNMQGSFNLTTNEQIYLSDRWYDMRPIDKIN
jgi:hypothetical protein